jgi:hypothetical protein
MRIVYICQISLLISIVGICIIKSCAKVFLSFIIIKSLIEREKEMIDFSKKRKKGARILLVIICGIIVFGMVIGLLVTAF